MAECREPAVPLTGAGDFSLPTRCLDGIGWRGKSPPHAGWPKPLPGLALVPWNISRCAQSRPAPFRQGPDRPAHPPPVETRDEDALEERLQGESAWGAFIRPAQPRLAIDLRGLDDFLRPMVIADGLGGHAPGDSPKGAKTQRKKNSSPSSSINATQPPWTPPSPDPGSVSKA